MEEESDLEPLNEAVTIVDALLPNGSRPSFKVPRGSSVDFLISLINKDPSIAKPPGRQTAIIYRGRILDGKAIISEVESMERFSVHVFFRIGKTDDVSKNNEFQDLRGFDVLSRMNYTTDQINELRNNFHSIHGTIGETHERQIEIEDEWLPVLFSQDNQLESLNTRPTPNLEEMAGQDIPEEVSDPAWCQFVLGFLIGSLFGIGAIMIILVSLQDKPLLLGLVCGITINLAVSYILGYSLI